MIDSKWLGTDIDRREMRTLNLQQVVRRNFGRLAMFGFASTLLCTWEVISLTLGVSLANGGTAGLFWNYVIAAIGLAFVYASIAELGSMIPTSGGQYYWVAIIAPRSCRRYLSYITGWLCAVSWQAGVAGTAYIAGTVIQALFVLNMPDYVYKRWQGSLLTLVFLLIAVIFNTFLARKLPMAEGIFVFLHILGIVIFIPLLILSPRREGGAPLVEFYNPSGWMSNGVATLVGVSAPVTALTGFDCSVHMAEETKDSSLTVPVSLLAGYTTNVIIGLFVLMICIYTIGPLEEALQASSGYPVVNMFYNATQSLTATDIMTTILIINLTASCVASLAAASRQLWSFARNHGVPFSRFFAPGDLSYDIPLNSVLVSLSIAIILALINIGSSEVLSIILSIFNAAIVASYIITISCMLMYRLLGRELPPARYTLGKWGVLVNICALIYLLPIFVFNLFPSGPNPTAPNMNWACVMVGGVTFLATAYYIIWGRKVYTPPNETFEDYIERYQATVSDVSGGLTEVKEVSGGGLATEKQSEKRDM